MITLIPIDTSEHIQLMKKTDKKNTIVQEACKMLDIKYLFSNNIFVDRQSYINSDKAEELKKVLIRAWGSKNDYTVLYMDLYRNHPRFDYYSVVGFSSLKFDDVKKILKVHKLKAFL